MITNFLQDPLIPQLEEIPVTPSNMLETPSIDWGYMAPMLILMVGALVWLLVISLLRRRVNGTIASLGTCLIAAASIVAIVPIWNRVGNPDEGAISAVAGAVGIDRFSLFVTGVLALAVIMASLLADGYLKREKLDVPELHVLLLFSIQLAALRF